MDEAQFDLPPRYHQARHRLELQEGHWYDHGRERLQGVSNDDRMRPSSDWCDFTDPMRCLTASLLPSVCIKQCVCRFEDDSNDMNEQESTPSALGANEDYPPIVDWSWQSIRSSMCARP